MKEVNERVIKLSGQVNVAQDLELTKCYHLLVEGAECRSVSELPNDDGTINRVFSLKVSELCRLTLKDGGQLIKTKAKGSPSQRLRNSIYYLNPTDNNDAFYHNFVNYLILNLPELLERYNSEQQKTYETYPND